MSNYSTSPPSMYMNVGLETIRSPSPAFSESSLEEFSTESEAGLDEPQHFDADHGNGSHSRAASPSFQDQLLVAEEFDESDSAKCLWEDCGKIFLHLPTLIDHIHKEHIGVNKSNYTCEWATCPRRGLQQASRFALISHLRAHTGEKPFTCPLPECDKSFTRSDAMAKHMRLQHNLPPPPPGRGGNRKRKRDEAEPPEVPSGQGFTTFKVDSATPTHVTGDIDEDVIPVDEDNGEYLQARQRSASPGAASTSSLDDGEDDLPPHLLNNLDPQTGNIFGRSPNMCRYIIMKAKHRYALEQHEQLLEELKVARMEERKEKKRKEEALDRVLGRILGPQAEFLVAPPDLERARPNYVADSGVNNINGAPGIDIRTV